MNNRPEFVDREALGNLVDALVANAPMLEEYYRDSFSGWDPIYGSDISLATYYATLKKFPLFAKRYIIMVVLDGWNLHKDFLKFHDSILLLIYLDLCGPAEYYMMQIIYNFMNSYGEILNDLPFIELECDERSFTHYWLIFYGDSKKRINYGEILFELHDQNIEPILAIVPTFRILRKTLFNNREIEFNDIEIYKVIHNISNIIENEWVKEHCSWIKSRWDFAYKKKDIGILYQLQSLSYMNLNGEPIQ